VKFLFLLENYNWYYTDHFNTHPGFEKQSYSSQIKALIDRQYYQSDSMGAALAAYNVTSEYLIPHCYPLQQSWAKDNDPRLYSQWVLEKPIRSINARVFKNTDTFRNIAEKTLIAQVKDAKADVIYIHSGIRLSKKTVLEIKKNCGTLILQWSCPIGNFVDFPFHLFDLICTSSVNIQTHFEKKNIPVLLLQQAFDSRILETIKKQEKTGDLVFIGSVNPLFHKTRIALLNQLLNSLSVDIYCPEDNTGDVELKKIMEHKKGSIGGAEMFTQYGKYKVGLHIPGDDFLKDAGAKRLFEVSGIGTLLLTLEQENIAEYLEPGKEIVTFRDGTDCIEKANYYLSHEAEREKIAAAGQARTLKEHTFENRAAQLLEVIKAQLLKTG
jgi:spore maturation protein CgeB